jgi:hypothetical protein
VGQLDCELPVAIFPIIIIGDVGAIGQRVVGIKERSFSAIVFGRTFDGVFDIVFLIEIFNKLHVEELQSHRLQTLNRHVLIHKI